MSPHLESTGSSRSAGGVESLRLRARQTLDSLRRELLESSTGEGYWTGRLSPSALSTATAVSALSAVVIHRDDWASSPEGTSDIANIQRCIRSGAEYLRSQQNEDGGFGDTDRSYSNIATSYLALAASTLARQAVDTGLDDQQRDRLQRYLVGAGELDGLRRRYGTDKTFVVPILTNLAIAGVVDWKDVPALPFEAAVFPQSLYRWLQMPVVSYAIPALVAIGQARHFHGPRTFWAIRTVRSASIARTINVLREMQPDSGGYLEATPLTSFVLMSLAATGRADHEVSRRGLAFLVDSMLDDGSWPIDTNLATWVTSLSIHALSRDPDDDGSWCTDSLVDWHLHCQHNRRHPFTGAEPGGWGWTDLSGAVPDSDDTPGAIIAQHQLMRRVDGPRRRECQQAIDRGINWLFRLQNRDGGWPTFCRGWGKLPFDRSSNDLTAHVLRAIDAVGIKHLSPQYRRRVRRATEFLHRKQRDDGSWLPLWFGNQDRDDESNPIYGTSRVLLVGATGLLNRDAVLGGCRYLLGAQNDDGGWGGGPSLSAWLARHDSNELPDDVTSSVEETSLAMEALVTIRKSWRNLDRDAVLSLDTAGPEAVDPQPLDQAIIRGIEFLISAVQRRQYRVPWPIGFYFAKLWYHEELYPIIFSTSALGSYLQLCHDPDGDRNC